MTPKKSFYIMLSSLSLTVILLITVIYFGNALLKKDSDKLVSLKLDNKVLEVKELGLAQAEQDTAKYSSLEEITQSIVPQDKDQAKAVREIFTLAKESGISLKSVTFPTSNLGTKVTPPKSSEGTTPESNAQPTPETAQAPNVISQAKPVQGINGVYSLEATIMPDGYVSYYSLIDFLSKLENNRRTSQVTRIKVDPQSYDNNNPLVDFLLTVNIFLKP
jgi:hypothetical protein